MRKSVKSVLKKVALVVLAVGSLVSGYQGAKYYHAGQPYLTGRCFVNGDGIELMVKEVVDAKTEDGKDVKAYLTVTVLGPIALQEPMLIRELNQAIKEMLASNEAEEVNCETGALVK